MRAWLLDFDVQAKGAEALGGLAWGNLVNIADILLRGGLEVLLASADTHIASPNVQAAVCYALHNIAECLGREFQASTPCVEMATRAKASHPEDKVVAGYADMLLSQLSKA